MKIRYQAPTEAFPFFHGVKVQTKEGWRRVKMLGPTGWVPALFPSEAEMMKKVRGIAP